MYDDETQVAEFTTEDFLDGRIAYRLVGGSKAKFAVGHGQWLPGDDPEPELEWAELDGPDGECWELDERSLDAILGDWTAYLD